MMWYLEGQEDHRLEGNNVKATKDTLKARPVVAMGGVNDVSQLSAPQHGVKQCYSRQGERYRLEGSLSPCFPHPWVNFSLVLLCNRPKWLFFCLCVCVCFTVFPEGHECEVGNEGSEGSLNQGEDDRDGVGDP